MAVLTKAREFPLTAIALCFIVLVGSFPLCCGVIVEPGAHPTLTLNVCHPLTSADRFLTVSYVPLPRTGTFVQAPRHDAGAMRETPSTLSSRPPETPETPPPRIFA
jgi:hypothetical protein